jgi:hemoglobin/transferrin/lactoferrin receptor protein
VLSFGVRHDSYELDHSATGVAWVQIDGVWIAEHDPTTDEKYSIEKESGFSKNLGLVYNITDNLAISAGYAEALRGRQVTDAFTIDQLVHNEDLKHESVANKELGLLFNDGTFIFEVSAYLSVIDDVVVDEQGQGAFHENIGDLESSGYEIVAGYQANNFDVLLSFNHNKVELNNTSFVWGDETVELNGVDLEAYEYGGLGNAIGDSINLSVNYELNDQLEMGFNLNYVADLNDIKVFHRSLELGWVSQLETVDKPGYTVADAYIRYEPVKNLSINLAIQNLFDESYRNHGSVADFGQLGEGYEDYASVAGIKEAGRDIRLTVAYTF